MKKIKDLLLSIFEFFGWAWWVEIVTENPRCTYYFGPFIRRNDAESATVGYVEDLEVEGAQKINVVVKRCKPNNLTVFEDRGDWSYRPQPSFSS